MSMKSPLISLAAALAGAALFSTIALADSPPAAGQPLFSVVIAGNVSPTQSASISGFANGVLTEWARLFGWTPRTPIMVRLYSAGVTMASDAGFYRGFPLTTDELVDVAARPGIGVRDARPLLPGGGTGGWIILLNVNPGNVVDVPPTPGVQPSQVELQGVLVHEMARAMINDLAGAGGPQWFREGILDIITNTKVLGLSMVNARLSAWFSANGSGTLPSVVTLDQNWQALISAPPGVPRDVPFAVSDQATFFLTQRVGLMPLIVALSQTSAGADFQTALRNNTGFDLTRLDTDYRAWMSTLPWAG